MLTYFLQVSLCWLVFYGLYYSLLSRETFFRLNRMYLMVSLLAGLIVPLGQYFIQVETHSQAAVMLEPFVVTAKGLQESWEAGTTEGGVSMRLFIMLIYSLGVGVMSWRFFFELFSVWVIYKQGEKAVQDGIKVVYTGSIKQTRKNVHLPFSFFNCIFINQEILDKEDIPQIMEHERAHVWQGHSYDVILLEVLKIIFWWNPIIYFYRYSLRNIHEYLADAAVLKWVERPIYGRLLIKQSQSGPALALANHFIFSQLKKRIIMMTRNRSQRASLLKYVIAFPLFTFLLTLFAIPNNEVMAKTKDLGEKVEEKVEIIERTTKTQSSTVKPEKLNSDSAKPLLNQDYIAQELKQSHNLYDVPPATKSTEPSRSTMTMPQERLSSTVFVEQDTSKDKVATVVDEQPEFVGGQMQLFKWLGQNIRYPQIARNNGIQGTVFVGFVVEKDGSISGVEIMKGVKGIVRDTIVVVGHSETNGVKGTKIVEREDHSIDNEATRVIAAMPNWRPGKQKGKAVRVRYTLPIKFKLE